MLAALPTALTAWLIVGFFRAPFAFESSALSLPTLRLSCCSQNAALLCSGDSVFSMDLTGSPAACSGKAGSGWGRYGMENWISNIAAKWIAPKNMAI